MIFDEARTSSLGVTEEISAGRIEFPKTHDVVFYCRNTTPGSRCQLRIASLL
jgi:hypothetical protein